MQTELFETKPDVEVRGILSHIRWRENGRVIAEVNSREYKQLSIMGDMDEPAVGQEYMFSGRLSPNPRFGGLQLKLSGYRTILPDNNDGIWRYLVQTAKWVGPKVATEILDAFGADALTIIKTSPGRVSAAVAGVTPERAEEMAEALKANERLEAATIEVNQLLGGVLGPRTTKKAIKVWGADAPHLLRRDPFRLRELPGVGFRSADAIAAKLGKPPESMRRHVHATIAALEEATARGGHTRIDRESLFKDASSHLGSPVIEKAHRAIERIKTVSADVNEIALTDLAAGEEYIAGKLAAMLSHQGEPRRFPAILSGGLADDQLKAVRLGEKRSVFLLVGAPGTGKTYTLARMVSSLQAAGLSVELCAPTGKAAKQMTLALADTCGGDARTIHSMLRPEIDEDGNFTFGHNASNPLDADVIVVDELSMVDVRLMRSLLRAVRQDARLLLVGDPYQLPSVGPGAVLRDLLRAGLPHYELTEIKRNAGCIVRACHAVKDGRMPTPAAKMNLDAGDNWRHLDVGTTSDIKGVIHELISSRLAAVETGLDPLWDIQTISPVNEAGALACDKLNSLIREILNPAAEHVGRLPYAAGDKVVRLRNGTVPGEYFAGGGEAAASKTRITRDFPDVAVVNGDIGIVEAIDAAAVYVRFRWPARRVRITRTEPHLKLAYCLTCHKMQGSECPVAILPLHKSLSRSPIWSREWIYTAMSRAKRALITVGDLDALRPGLKRVSVNARVTRLEELTGRAMA